MIAIILALRRPLPPAGRSQAGHDRGCIAIDHGEGFVSKGAGGQHDITTRNKPIFGYMCHVTGRIGDVSFEESTVTEIKD